MNNRIKKSHGHELYLPCTRVLLCPLKPPLRSWDYQRYRYYVAGLTSSIDRFDLRGKPPCGVEKEPIIPRLVDSRTCIYNNVRRDKV